MTTIGTVEIEVGGQQLRCTFEYTKETPDVRYLPNGDPGYPGDPSEFYVTKVELFIGTEGLGGTKWLDITDLVEEVGGFETVNERAEEQADKEGFFDEPDGVYGEDEPDEDDGTLADRAAGDWEAWRDQVAAHGEDGARALDEATQRAADGNETLEDQRRLKGEM